ncbi:hypothetical protein SELMODRAFT_101977 [Selaginella moellendorffii]|uniref:non-specific serine/threonine protein kinase n=2 Tax=Selaginella moellendorffii TaxID=88036 RepID=D8RUE0_SELML|nr:hypothetical protein SELMODRAFT_101977 [Selaginella moellendorffii]
MAKALAIVFSIVALDAIAALDDHVSFTYSSFSGLARNDFVATGDATINNDELRLTGNRLSSYGRIMKQQEIQLCNASASAAASFSTEFVFAITKNDSTQVNADGLAFTIAPNLTATSAEGYGRWLGLFDPAANGRASNRIVAVEFDTFRNFPPDYPEFQDIDGNHVGLDINGILSVNSSSLNPRGISLGIGTVAARIDYDAAVQGLRVFVSSDPSFRNLGDPVLEHSLNLCAYVSDVSYVGFSAGSGTANLDFHRILSWNFSSRLERIPPPSPVTVVDGGKKKDRFKVYFIVTASLLALLAALLLLAVVSWLVKNPWSKLGFPSEKKKKKSSSKDLVPLPHEIPYAQLAAATQEFSEHNLLGTGGFGSVYRGILPGENSPVAIKKMARDSHQGEREFLAELQIISKLSHRNLVPLRGWHCARDHRELVLVYDYMPQGSVESALFHKCDALLLLWDARLRILSGLAAALIYLHEDWEQQIIHRDVKCSNVMLDDEFRARLGDFGLARTASHDVSARVTTLAGTLGYIAPEVGVTYKFTPASDVYSYGVVALEVVTGRRVIGSSKEEKDHKAWLLLPWVEEEYAAGKLLGVVDPRLKGIFNAEEATTVLVTALRCVDSNPGNRPTMRQVRNLLSGVLRD